MKAIRFFALALLAVGCASAPPREASAFVALGWADSTGGLGQTQIERRTGALAYALIVTVPIGVTQYTDAAVTTSTTYCYRARAVVGSAVSGYTTEVCGTTLPPPPPPSASVRITLTLSTSGGGAGGTVASTPAGIFAASPGTYSAVFPEFATVTFTETPKNNRSRFVGWSGPCSGTSRACTFKIIADTPVGAGFAR